MEGKQKLDLKILLDKPSFYIDEIITGNLIFQTKRSAIIEKIVIEIIFFQKFNTAINTQNAPIICYEKLCCFELDLNPFLSKVEGCYILKGGNTKIPFKIDLKRDLYPCFEFPLKDKYAFLRYKMDINIFSMSFNKTQFSHYIRLLSRPIINDKNKCLNKSISKNLKKWNIINIGTTTLTVSIPDNNCKYDDTNFKVIVFIDNLNGKESTKEIKVKLMRTIELYNQNNKIAFKEELPVASRVIPAIVPPGGNNYFEVFLPLRESDTSRYIYNNNNNPIPYDFFLSDINFYMPTIFSRCITCKYELIVSLNFNCFVYENSLPKITFPIYMTNQSPFEYQLDFQKKEYEKKNKFYTNDVNENFDNNKIKINNYDNIIENNKQFVNNNSGGSINKFDAPNPFNQYKNIDIDVNIFQQNNNNINKSKTLMINNENMNINAGNNFKYNFNISINNNLEGNINNNINNNIINNNLNNNNIIENDNNIIENENGYNNEKRKKSIKESNFNLL